MSSSIFRLTDGTETINLMTNEPDGFYLQSYAPILSGFKGGGVFQDSPLADNRRPVYTRRETVVQPIVLSAKALSHDNISRMLQDLVRLLDKAKDYWVSDWQNEPVWLEAKTAKETNLRYALVYMWRIEDYPAPYQQPFQQEGGTPVAQEMTLFLEHGQWLDIAPNVEGGVSSEIVGARYYPSTNTLIVTEDGTFVLEFTDSANTISDLPDGTNGMTVEFWFRYLGPDVVPGGTSTTSPFAFMRTSPINWEITTSTISRANVNVAIYDSGGEYSRAECRFPTTIVTPSGTELIWTYRGWIHVAMTFNKNGSTLHPQLWINGAVASVTNTTDAAGAYTRLFSVPDIQMMGFALPAGAASGFDFFEYGWFRVSDTERYTTAFTPPEICSPPSVDANTVFQYNLYEGQGTVVGNNEGTAGFDATLDTSAIWSTNDDCMLVPTFGQTEETTGEVFVANKFSLSIITNIHVSTAGSNLVGGSWPATISSSTNPTYIGSNTAEINGGIFNSVVLDIVSGVDGLSPTFEYWDGSTWSALTISNDLMPGSSFELTGKLLLNWKPPADWATNSPGGSLPTGWWIRISFGTNSLQHAGPNAPYTVTWPFIQIDADQLPGDIPALARMLLRPVGSDGTNNASGAADKIIYGSRSLARGQSFRSHLNLSDVGNVSGISVVLGTGSFISNTQAPTGRLVSYTATTSFADIAVVLLNGAISRDYAGRFRVFVRFAYDIGTANTLTWIFRVEYGTDGSYFDSRPLVIDDTYEGTTPLANAYLMEFNPIHIRPDLLVGNDTDIAELAFYPFVITDTGTATIYLHDIVLIPIDEFSGEVERSPQSSLQADALNLIDLDGTNQKLYNRAVKRSVSDNRIREVWLSRGVLPPSLQANATQRVFFLQRSTGSASNPEQSVSWQTLGVQMGKVSRYLGFRGDR